jgi:NAD(P)-dependent dehydrogenase (short-subunit alcohol dehydrogenase family)
MAGRASFDYSGETAIVTGSTKGIGRGIAETLAEAGADVVVNSRTPADVSRVAEEPRETGSGDAAAVAPDMSDPEAVEHLVESAVDAFGTPDLLVNNAAVWPREGSMLEADLEDWNHAMHVNVRGFFYAARLVGEQMVENDVEGAIVNVTSQAGDRRSAGAGLYGASKTAINGLTWRMAYDFGRHGVRVNGLSTSRTDSYQLRKGVPEDEVEAVYEEFADEIPLGRVGQPADLGDAVLYLGSDAASYVAGAILRVSGGDNLN